MSDRGIIPGFVHLAYRCRVPQVCIFLLAALLTGCHHSQPVNVASLPPPPAPAPIERPHRTTVKPPLTAPAEPVQPDTLGERPVSTEVGLASWYGPPYHNRQAADGSIFDQNALTAAHRTLPMGTTVRVTNLANNESVVVKITDRGSFVTNRILDLSCIALSNREGDA